MQWIGEAWRRLAFFSRRGQFRSELKEEMDDHVRMKQKDLTDEGMPSDEARNAVRREFGNTLLLRERSRDAWGFAWLETLLQDLRYSLRQLRRNPGFTVSAVLTLALGIGANTAIFTVVNAVLLEPLPYRSPRLLIYISEFWPHERPVRAVPTPDFTNWQANNTVFEGLAAYGGYRRCSLTSSGEPELIEGINVSTHFFSVLGVGPFLGRTFLPKEAQPAGNRVVILGHAIWQQRFGSDTRVLGRSVMLDDQDYAVVGVLPASFRFPDNRYDPQLFFPDTDATAANWHSPQYFALQPVIGRLGSGVTQTQARAQLMTLIRRTAAQEPIQFVRMRAGMEIRMVSLHERLSGSVRPLLLILLGAVGLVLLVACVNVACLELARATGRQREMAVRAALGAGRSRIVRQLVTEGVLLSSFGGMVALITGFGGVRLVRALRPPEIPHFETIGMDGRVFAFTIAIAVISGVICGLAPAVAPTKADLIEALKEGGSIGAAASSRHPVQGSLVASEVALASVLLAAAVLMARTFAHVINTDPGCRLDHILTFRVALPRIKYSESTQQINFFVALLRRVRALPGVESAAFASGIPVEGSEYVVGTAVEGKPMPPRGSRPDVPYDITSQRYFRTLGIPLIAGRTFNQFDTQNAPEVAVVNQAFARQFFPGRNVLGKHVYTGSWREIVGVVGNVRQNGPTRPAEPEVYAPYLQGSAEGAGIVVVVRTVNRPLTLISEIRKSVEALDESVPVYDVATMRHRVSNSIAPERLNMLLLGLLSGLALVLVAVGIYGVISYSVAQRKHELGIRTALGAQRAEVLKLIVGWALKPTIIGIAIGIAGALALTRFLSSLLYGVKPTDPLTFIAVILILTAVALLACYIPARRAAKVDPMVALRYE
jgi:predicted permease